MLLSGNIAFASAAIALLAVRSHVDASEHPEPASAGL
jgi:hypothetical protein